MSANERGQSVVEFQRDPPRYLAAASTVLGPEVHDLVSQVELPKPAAAALRRAKKIAPVKFSRTGDMGRIAMIQSAIVAGDDDKQRKIGYRIGQIMTEVGLTTFNI